MALDEELKQVKAVGQISTSSGEEILSVSENDDEQNTRLTKLAAAYVEIQTLSRSLKLGTVKQVVTASGDGKSFTVQSKNEPENGTEQEKDENALLNTAIAGSLAEAFVADGIINETTSHLR